MNLPIGPTLAAEGCLFTLLIVSGLTFRSLICLEFIFVYGVREHQKFILIFMLRNLPSVLHSGCSQFPFAASV